MKVYCKVYAKEDRYPVRLLVRAKSFDHAIKKLNRWYWPARMDTIRTSVKPFLNESEDSYDYLKIK